MRRRPPRHAVAARLAVVAVALSACSRVAEPRAAGPAARAPRAVRLGTVAEQPLPRTLEVHGVLVAHEQFVVAMQVGGRLQELSVDVGDAVAAGQTVARLDPRDFELERDRTEAAMRAAHARLGVTPADELGGVDPATTAPVREARALLDEARRQRDRIAERVREQRRREPELETAEASLLVAQSRLQRAREDVEALLAEAGVARVQLAQAEKRLADAAVTAPWPGRVAARQASAGEVVAAGAPLLTLVRTDPLRLQLRVPERAVPAVAVGQRVRFTVDGHTVHGAGEPVFEGFVTRLGAVVDRGNRTRLVEAAIANADGALLPGAFCRAAIVTEPDARALVAPKAAVATFAGVARVFTVDAGAGGAPARAHGHVVGLGRGVGDAWELVSGIDAGAEVVLEPGELRHGDPVVPATAAARER